MTSHDDLDRRLTAWLDEEAAPRAPVALTEAFAEGIGKQRQRRGWATSERWISMETRAQLGAVPRAAIILATLALLSALAAGAIAVGSSSGPSLPEPFGAAGNGLIAFEHAGDIYVVEPDGGGRRAIASGPETEGSPIWSRDGERLAYWSERADGTTYDLFVVDADGENRAAVAETSDEDASTIEWSEDGSEVMFSARVPDLGTDPCPVPISNGGSCGSRLFVAPTDGSGEMRQVGDADLDARSPVLSPDGNTVAFGGGDSGAVAALYLMDWDGSNLRRLDGVRPSHTWAFVQSSWSADGDTVATHDDGPIQGIWIVASDGSGPTYVSDEAGGGNYPFFAPDGSALLWSRDGSTTLWIPGDDPTSVQIPIDPLVWSPDGERLVGSPDGVLRVVDRDGATIGELGKADVEQRPSWQRIAQ